jgi:poly(3-hydroxybutyrate) depolymerase
LFNRWAGPTLIVQRSICVSLLESIPMRKPFTSLEDLVRKQRAGSRPAAQTLPSRLGQLSGFGTNPGGLDLFAHVPAGLTPGAALVVVLHGCKQDARGYDRGTGWSELAEREGFAVLAPEQRGQNNPGRCFNWFEPAHTTRFGSRP